KPWETGDGKPRRACVSSFGYSGTNAHIVIEEYQPEKRYDRLTKQHRSALFALSAKKEKQLKAYAEAMKDFVTSNEDIDLEDMAYTLQTGREAMDYRMAFLADSREMLIKALDDYLAEMPNGSIFAAHVKTKKSEIKLFETDHDAKALLQTWIEKKRLEKVAELWVKGLQIDWNKLYGEYTPRRISLPAYPFAEEYYWLPTQEGEPETIATAMPQFELMPKRCFLRKQWQPCPI
ncbi:ketoacyl-synthetase C-terminal extension domain-containing protein, partial [Bacillus subtilis]